MKKLTNTIGSYVVAIIIIAFPIIVGVGMESDWLEADAAGVAIHPLLTLLWIVCVGCTIIEVGVLAVAMSDSEDI